MKNRYLKFSDVCKHPPVAHKIVVIESNVNCETTVIECAFCHTRLTEPETDC